MITFPLKAATLALPLLTLQDALQLFIARVSILARNAGTRLELSRMLASEPLKAVAAALFD